MNRILLSFVCCTALISTVNVYSETSSVDNQSQNYVTKQTYGPITTYETLWSVSNKLRPNKDVSVYQTLLAIYKTNPSAFLNGDINKIIINSVIDIPSTSFIAQQRNTEALKLLNIDPKKLSITDDLSIVKPQPQINPIEENKKEQSVNESLTQESDALTVENVTTETTDAKYYLPDISDIQKPISQDEIEDREQGMIYLSDLPSIDKKTEPQEDTSVLAQDDTDLESLPTTTLTESNVNEETSTTDLIKDAQKTTGNYEESLVAVEETALENEPTKLGEGVYTEISVEKDALLADEETPAAKNVQVNLSESESDETTNLSVQNDSMEAEQTTAFNETEMLATEVEQEVETDRPLAEESTSNIADEPVLSGEVIEAEKGNTNTVNPEISAAADLNESLNANDETGNIQSNTEEFVNNSEAEQTTDSVAQALIEEMKVEQEESNSLPAPFSEAELQNQAKTEKTQSDIDKELARLYAQLNTVTEANEVLKQRLQPLSEQITLLSNQLNEDASIQDELQSLVEEYKEKIESYEKSPYNGEGFHNTIFRYITESPIALISAILVPLILLSAIFLFLLRRKNNQDSLPAEEANKSEIACEEEDELDGLDDFDILLSELTVLKNDYVEGDANTEDINTQQANLEDDKVVEKAIVLSEIEEYLDPEEEIISSDESIAESFEEVNDLQETINVQSDALDIKNDQQTEKDHSLAIPNEQQATNKKVVEEITQMAEAESSKASEAGGRTVNTDAPIDEAKEAGENKVVIGVPQDKEQENHASSDENKTDQDYIEIDYLLSNNDGSEVSEEEFDLDFGLDEFPDVINATDFDTDADRISAQLDLARAYLEIDEKKNAKAILVKLLDADEDKLVEVHRLLERIG